MRFLLSEDFFFIVFLYLHMYVKISLCKGMDALHALAVWLLDGINSFWRYGEYIFKFLSWSFFMWSKLEKVVGCEVAITTVLH